MRNPCLDWTEALHNYRLCIFLGILRVFMESKCRLDIGKHFTFIFDVADFSQSLKVGFVHLVSQITQLLEQLHT